MRNARLRAYNISLLYPHHKHRFDNNKVNTEGSKIMNIEYF
jgi:hypothetical protein